MQQSHVSNVPQKRKNIYKVESDEESSGSAKKIKLSQDQPDGFQAQSNNKSTTPKEHNVEIIENNNGAAPKTSCITLADHIRSYEFAPKDVKTPDPHLQQLYLNVLKARNIRQLDAANEVPCHSTVLSAYRNSYKREQCGWNRFERQLFAWMMKFIIFIPRDYKLEYIKPDEVVQKQKERTFGKLQPKKSTPKQKEDYNIEELMADFDESEEFEVKHDEFMRQPESIFSRLSTPKYLQVSDEQKTDQRLDQTQPLFGNLPQTIAGIQIDYTHLPYLSVPKPSEISSNYGNHAASRLIYEKMLEAWQGENEFHEEKSITQEKHTEIPKVPSVTPKTDKTPAPRQYSAREAAYMILKKAGKPLTVQQITRLCQKEGFLNLNGQPFDRSQSIASPICNDLKKQEKSWFIRVGQSRFTVNPNFVGKGKLDPRNQIPEDLV